MASPPHGPWNGRVSRGLASGCGIARTWIGASATQLTSPPPQELRPICQSAPMPNLALLDLVLPYLLRGENLGAQHAAFSVLRVVSWDTACLLYTSDAADDLTRVDLG